MSSEVAISVIMSTRNRAHYLPEVLRILAAQDCDASFEVIAIDNASTDNTAAVLNEWCRTDARVRTARERRPGLSRGGLCGILFQLSERKSFFQRARGAAFASGRWLDSLGAARTSMRLFLGAGRVAFSARSLLLRLTPDVS